MTSLDGHPGSSRVLAGGAPDLFLGPRTRAPLERMSPGCRPSVPLVTLAAGEREREKVRPCDIRGIGLPAVPGRDHGGS